MSLFFKNTCQYNNCRRSFYSLSDLILHIETDHIDFDPFKIEQLEEEKPESLPLSYVLKYSGPDACPQYSYDEEISFFNEAVIQDVDDVAANEVVSAFNNNYLSCDFKEVREKRVKSETRLIINEIPQVLGGTKLFTLDHSQKKPFSCNMGGCEKRYKNVNGIKYHYKKYHKMIIPTLKKSFFEPQPIMSSPKPKLDKHDLHGIPLYSYKPMMSDFLYHNMHPMHSFEECEALSNEYYYKSNPMPTSDVSSTQVPLPNMSFNCYNINDMGDIEEFSGRNSSYFIPNF